MDMEMEFQIISRETIKPSSPTPNHLRTHKLSIIDQLAIQCYVPVLLFYPSNGQDSSQRSSLLKKSLSQILTHFYPFAGREVNSSWIDCNDEGASFVEANVAADLSMLLKQPQFELLQQLLPCKPNENSVPFRAREILAVQVNYFICGGMTIGVCIKHLIADASTVASFIERWGAVACFADTDVNGVILDRTSLFPPIDKTEGLSWGDSSDEEFLPEIVMKRLVFNGSKIAALRERVGNGLYLDRPSRFEAVSALIWGASIAATRETDETVDYHVAMSVVDLRKKLNPPLPQQCIGNICQVTTAKCSMEKSTDYNELAQKIRESIRKVDDESVRKFHEDGKWLDFVKKLGEEYGKKSKVRMFKFSSWCRFPFYEADFGWGKPIWVSTAMEQENGAIFLDSSDGQGIEAWVALPKEDMTQLEQNPDILEFASFS
ncbi:stemmadenine O-acetyltransferase-like [Hevea brasiliensis]|nr:stemmadenine O-acetyltransferase-like [Hevea brasiliensis]